MIITLRGYCLVLNENEHQPFDINIQCDSNRATRNCHLLWLLIMQTSHWSLKYSHIKYINKEWVDWRHWLFTLRRARWAATSVSSSVTSSNGALSADKFFDDGWSMAMTDGVRGAVLISVEQSAYRKQTEVMMNLLQNNIMMDIMTE